jgi:hypothetical protein
MAGFDGRIGIEGNSERGKQLLGTALKHAARQRELKNILGLSGSTKAYDLGGGAYCVVVDLEHMRVLHIVAPTPTSVETAFEEPLLPQRFGPGVYDVLAGYTNNPQIVVEEITDKKGKKKKIDVIKQFKPTNRTEKRYKDLTRRQRLAVEENDVFAPLENPNNIRYTEHAHCKPSNYTGLMQQVVQLVMGIGKVLRPTAEEAMKLPPLPPVGTDLLTKKARNMISGFGLYGQETLYTPRVNFDYRFPKTHGVTFDQDGVAWVIEIGMRGVHAMRLYLDPVSMTKEGAERWIKVSPELTDFILLFGGIPLGIGVPTFELFDKAKRAGEVIELISQSEMRAFYSKQPMSSDTGWAFSDFGTEAHNTCWEYDLVGIKRGFHFAVSIALQQERFKDWTPARSELAAKVSNKFYEVNKCRRMLEADAKTLLDVYKNDGVEKGYKAFDDFVVKPTLIGSARLSLQRSGYLYHGAKFDFQPQIKFPEELVGAELSFDFSDAGLDDSPRRVLRKVHCDTPMYVCFIQGQLEVISYYMDNVKPPTLIEGENASDRQECQTTGSWTNINASGGVISLQGNFYSQRWDFRREQISQSVTTTKCKSEKVAAWPAAGAEFLLSSTWYTWTTVAFYVDCVQTTAPVPPSLSDSVGIPQGDRSAYYFAKLETTPNQSVYYNGYIETYQGPIKELWFVYHFLYAWVGGLDCPPQDWIDKGGPACWAHHHCDFVNPNACVTDYLQGDFWINACSPGPGWSAGFEAVQWPVPQLPAGYNYSVPDDHGQANGDVYFVNNTPYGETITKQLRETATHGSSLSSWWWKASPDPAGFMPSLRAVRSCLGESVSNFMDEFNGVLKHLGGPEYMFASWSDCYTGVIE